MDRFNSLMDEGRYVAADEIGEQELARLAPNCRSRNRRAWSAHMTGAG